jgi:type II secretory pathway pseudopilin PulG
MTRSPRMKNRKGLTLVELIVAVTILMFGLLTIVGISSTTARALGEARSDGLAAQAAQSRFEWMASLKCEINASGLATGLYGITTGSVTQVTNRGITERYKVVLAPGAIGNNVLILYDTLTWQTRRTTRRQSFETLLPCRNGA